jgi:SAM-dependent methyltransferase
MSRARSLSTIPHADDTSSPEDRKLSVLQHIYPEAAATGFSRDDQMVVFYTMVNALVGKDKSVLDFGAGRGEAAEFPLAFKRHLLNLKGKCAKVVGFDLDPAVRRNPLLDEAVVGRPGEPLPFPDASFDVIVSRAAFEHVEDPIACARELGRVLKPGGWLCAWTVNRWGIVAIGGSLVPNALHHRALQFFEPGRKEQDVFPTHYRMNSLGTLRRLFPAPDFNHASYTFSGPPVYHGNRLWLARIWQAYEALMPRACRRFLHVFVQKAP